MIEERVGQAVAGDVPAAIAGEAWARIAAGVDGLPVEGLRVRLSEAGVLSGQVLGQVGGLATGRRVRIQAAGSDYDGAINALCRRLRARVAEASAGFPPRPWPEPDGAPHPPEAPSDPRGAGQVVRVKQCVLVWSEIDAAAAMLEAMDYRAHLFTDPDTGSDAVIYRAGPTGYRLTRLAPGAALGAAAGGPGVVVAYEADQIDPDTHVGWSVVVTGLAHLATDPEQVARYKGLLTAWVAGQMSDAVLISLEMVTGYRLVAGRSNTPMDTAR
jgi:hypothetical protein